MAVEDGNTKVCTGCRQEKSVSQFSKNLMGRNGLRSRCKTCTLARRRTWVRANIARVAEVNRLWASRNKAKRTEAVARHRKKHRELMKRRCSEWRLKNIKYER